MSHCGVLLQRKESPRKSAPPIAGAVFDNERRRGSRGGAERGEGERSSCEGGWVSGDVRHCIFMPAP